MWLCLSRSAGMCLRQPYSAALGSWLRSAGKPGRAKGGQLAQDLPSGSCSPDRRRGGAALAALTVCRFAGGASLPCHETRRQQEGGAARPAWRRHLCLNRGAARPVNKSTACRRLSPCLCALAQEVLPLLAPPRPAGAAPGGPRAPGSYWARLVPPSWPRVTRPWSIAGPRRRYRRRVGSCLRGGVP